MPANNARRDRRADGSSPRSAAKAGARSDPATTKEPAAAKEPTTKGSAAAKPTRTRAAGAKPGSGSGARSGGNRPAPGRPTPRPGGRPPARSRSIVTQKRRPWGLIAATLAVVVFTAAVIGYAISQSGGKSNGADPYTRNEIAAVKDIPGATYKKEPAHTHVSKKVAYNSSPPVGGNHSQYWADCTGTVYPNAIANENAVHALEHGAVWIAYKPGLSAADVKTLSGLVTGQDRMLMSPYPGLDGAVSVQAWGYQLKVSSAADPRIKTFIDALRFNPATTPEPSASCSNPPFKTAPSTPENPIF